jgi:hypothetical protein
VRFEQFSSQFSSHFSQVEGAKDEIVCWDLYSLEVLTKLDLTTALPGAGAFLDPERNMERAEHCWTQHLFYHGFIMDLSGLLYILKPLDETDERRNPNIYTK